MRVKMTGIEIQAGKFCVTFVFSAIAENNNPAIAGFAFAKVIGPGFPVEITFDTSPEYAEIIPRLNNIIQDAALGAREVYLNCESPLDTIKN